MRFLQFLLLASFLIGLQVWANPAGYDELHDQQGHVRPQYELFYENWARLTQEEKESFLQSSRQAFQGDNALDALPRVLTGAEYDQVIKPGVIQRARALRALLQDHYSGKKTYATAGIIPKAVLDRIIFRANESGYEGQVPPDTIWFPYGPDIIRDEHGVFRVIEDNPGYIGGTGDMRMAYQEILRFYQQDPNQAPFRSPEEFYGALAQKFKKEAKKFGGRAVVYMPNPHSDKEDLRLQNIFRSYGIQTVSDRTRMRLLIQKDGVYLQDSQNPGVPLEKIGFVTLMGEHHELDTSHPESKYRNALIEIDNLIAQDDLDPKKKVLLEKALAKLQNDRANIRMVDLHNLIDNSGFVNDLRITNSARPDSHGLINAILNHKVGANYSPGLDFLGDKEFYTYVEDLIRFYLKETPILRNIETKRFAAGNTEKIDEARMTEVFSNISKWVIKKVDGRGGDAVWVGPKIKPEEIPMLQTLIRREPRDYIVQAFTPLSRMNDIIVDLRVIADVSPNNILVTETPWGRGLPLDGNGKVNLSDKGREITVLVQNHRAPFCKSMFQSF